MFVSAHPRSPAHLALGRAVRVLRMRRRLSQEQLGARSGVHRNYVGGVERGELNPTYAVLLRLCIGLGVPLSQLVALAERVAAWGGGAGDAGGDQARPSASYSRR